MIEESQGLNTFMDPDPNGPKPRVELGKTLAFYAELSERLEAIDKQFVDFEAKMLGCPESSDVERAKKLLLEGDSSESGYIARLDGVAVRIHVSVCSLADIVGRLNDAI